MGFMNDLGQTGEARLVVGLSLPAFITGAVGDDDANRLVTKIINQMNQACGFIAQGVFVERRLAAVGVQGVDAQFDDFRAMLNGDQRITPGLLKRTNENRYAESGHQ